jgi:hypothetical protein
MVQFASYGLGLAVVNDFCPVPRRAVRLRVVIDVPRCACPALGPLVFVLES